MFKNATWGTFNIPRSPSPTGHLIPLFKKDIKVLRKRKQKLFVQIPCSCQTLWLYRVKVIFSDLCCCWTRSSTSAPRPSLPPSIHPALLPFLCLRGPGLVITGLEQEHTPCIHTSDSRVHASQTAHTHTHTHLRTASFNNIQRESTANPLPFMD